MPKTNRLAHPKRLSINDIAKQAGLSKTTVSLIINGKAGRHRIKPATCQKVMKLVAKSGFRPSQTAIGLRQRRTRTIGLVVADIANWYFANLARSLERECKSHGFNLILANSDDDERTEKQTVLDLLSRSVDGLIIASAQRKDNLSATLEQYGTPGVYIDRSVPGSRLPCVTSDNRVGAAQLTDHLIKAGAQQIAVVAGTAHLSTGKERLEGCKQALRKSDLKPKRRWVYTGDFSPRSGYDAARTFFSSGARPDGVFTASFTLLQGFLWYLQKHEPEQVTKIPIATFDNHPMLDLLPFPVDAARQDHEKLASTALDCLRKLLGGKKVRRSVTIPPRLIIRRK